MSRGKDSASWKSVAHATAVLFVFIIASVAGAQELPAQLPSPSPAVVQPQQTQTPVSTAEQSAGSTERPLYGLQGVLVETLDGKQVASQSIDQQFNPASNVKLATALIALQTLGPDHRFATGVWTDGTFDKATGKIEGNLYISGRDPSFHYEHAIMDSLRIHYFASKVTYGTADCDITAPSAAEVSPDSARYVVIALCVRIAAAGVPNTAGYQPASNVLLVSDVTLRNSNLIHY